MRRGSSTVGLCLIIAFVASSASMAFVMGRPATAIGDQCAYDEAVALGSPLLDRIARLAGQSRGVLLASNPTSEDPFTELVVWVNDTDGSGTPQPKEIGVLAHSKVLQSVVWFPPVDQQETDVVASFDAAQALCRARRTDRRGDRQIIGRSISDLKLDWTTAAATGQELLEITLTSSLAGTDGPQRAQRCVDAHRPHWGAGSTP